MKKSKRKLKSYEIDMGERGIYNTKNKLNDLTGKEWSTPLHRQTIYVYLTLRQAWLGFGIYIPGRTLHPLCLSIYLSIGILRTYFFTSFNIWRELLFI